MRKLNKKYGDKQGAYDSQMFIEPANDLQDPKEKVTNPEYFRKKAERLYWSYCNGYTTITFDMANDFQNNRLYSQGRQPNIKYMDTICPKDKKTGKREGYDTISWDNFPVMPKMRAMVMGKFDPIDYAVNVNCVDELSNNQRDLEKLRYFTEQKDKAFFNDFYAKLGVPQDKPNLPFEPKSIEDLDMMSEVGSFKLMAEIILEAKLKKSLDHSDWSELKKRLIEDAFDCGFICAKDYTDPVTGEAKTEYVDPAYFLVRQTRSNNFEDIAEAARIKLYSCQQLRSAGVPEEDLYKCVRAMSGLFGNNDTYNLNWDTYMGFPSKYDTCVIAVLDGESESLDTDYYEMDGDRIYKTKWGEAKPSKSRYKMVKPKYHKWYRYKWVIGTDVVFDYGYQFDQVYDQHNKPRSSFSCYRITERAIASNCISVIDDLQVTIQKLRLAWANAAPPGLAIEISSLSGLSIGGEKLNPWELVKIYTQKGHMLYKATLGPGGVPLQGTGKWIEPLNSPITPYLQACIMDIDMHLNHLRELTGISQVVDGSNPQPGQLTGVTQIQEQGTNNVLRPLLSAYQWVKKDICRKMAWRHQLQAKVKLLTGDYSTFGDKVLAELEDITKPTVDVNVEVLLDDAMVQRIDTMALESVRAAKTGQVGITASDYFFIQRALQTGQLKYAEFYLSAREAEQKATLQRNAQQMQEMNTQGALALEAAKQKTFAMGSKFEMDKVMASKTWDYNIKTDVVEEQGKNALALERLRGKNAVVVEEERGDNALEVADENGKNKPAPAKK